LPYVFSAVGYNYLSRLCTGNQILILQRVRGVNRWNALPCEFLFKQHTHWQSWKKEYAMQPVSWQAFVRPGWRVIAKNITTGNVEELGFIDEDDPDRSLNDITLPDGEYEISVLTSSLFWKDCIDRTIRTISIQPGEQMSPLPLIYNLRSSVGEGKTSIRWSASHSEVNDCVFGIWYASEPSVDISRPPDTTIWYTNTITEYQTSFKQNAPAYIAIAPIRTGNNRETGVMKELYLEWCYVPPAAPEDVAVLDKPLPAIDPIIAEKNADAKDTALWF
ncbi:MAG: hypothetical protein ACRC2T_16995, partial [Thermoguttaceae bacterium]